MLLSLNVNAEDLNDLCLSRNIVYNGGREAVAEQSRDVIGEMVDDVMREDCYSFLACVDNNFGVDGDVEAEDIT